MLGNRLIKREQARVEERHGTGGDDRLRHALKTEERILRQRLLRLDVLPAEGFEVAALAFVMDEADDTGDFLIRHGLLQGDVELREHLGLQSGLRDLVAM